MARRITDAEPPRQPTESAAERQAGDAGRRVDAERRRHAEGLRLVVDVAERRARLDVRPPRPPVDADGAQEREIDHQPAVADRVARDVVSAAAHGQQQVVVAGEGDAAQDVVTAREPVAVSVTRRLSCSETPSGSRASSTARCPRRR
jgi:hypothetical protein